MIAQARRMAKCAYKAAYLTVTHDGFEHAGYMAFLGLLSFFPFLVFIVAAIGMVGQGEVGAQFITSVMQTLPPKVSEALLPRIQEILSGPPTSLITLSVLGALWTASSGVEGMRTILNRAYHVKTPPNYLLRRLMSILQLLLFVVISVVCILFVVMLPVALDNVEALLNVHFMIDNEETMTAAALYAAPLVMFAAIAYIYFIIPNVRLRFSTVAPGALIVTLAWLTSAHLFTFYLLHSQQMTLIYGSLGGIIAALLFFYICNIIFIFGAEFNHQMALEWDMHHDKEQFKNS